MEKKKKSLKTQKLQHQLNSKLLMAAKPVATVLPTAVIMGVNFEEWFTKDWKIGTGGIIAMVIMGLASLLVNKKSEDKSITNGYITLVIGWYIVAFVFMLLGQVMEQIWWIMMIGGTGILAGAGIDIAEQSEIKKANIIQAGTDEAEKERVKEQAKAEATE